MQRIFLALIHSSYWTRWCFFKWLKRLVVLLCGANTTLRHSLHMTRCLPHNGWRSDFRDKALCLALCYVRIFFVKIVALWRLLFVVEFSSRYSDLWNRLHLETKLRGAANNSDWLIEACDQTVGVFDSMQHHSRLHSVHWRKSLPLPKT